MAHNGTDIRTSVTRRTALKYSGEALVGVLSAFAGCNGESNGEGGTTAQTGQPTETDTASSSAETTGSDTAQPIVTGSTTATGLRYIGLSPLAVYTNDSYSYSIKYPAKWSIDKNNPMHVTFTSPTALGSMEVAVEKDISRSYTLRQATSDFLDRLGPTHEYNPMVKVLTRRKMALPNSHPAILLYFQISGYRENVVITVVNNTVYSVRISFVKQVYTSTIVQQINDILTSLTIRAGITLD